ncbi:MAG: GNAT family N-acetyltransferase [Advenella sp.]
MNISKPEKLSQAHNAGQFCSGEKSLDDWIRQKAYKNQINGGSRTFVACDENKNILAYYALATGVLDCELSTGKFRRNMPNPIPVVILARLAVDGSMQGKGIGRALVRDAGLRVIQAADLIGIRGIVVQALTDEAKNFYEKVGFTPSPIEPMTLLITLADLKAHI